MRKFLSGFLFFSVGLAATLELSRAFMDVSPDPLVQFKLDRFLENKDEYTTLIIGSSTSYRNVNPVMLDQVLKAGRVDSRSYSLALPGAGPFETHALLKRVLTARPKKLSLVIMDAREVYRGLDNANWTTRDIYWHGPAQTFEASRYWAQQKRIPFIWAGLQISKELQAFALNMLLWGRGAAAVFGPNIFFAPNAASKLIENSGFMALDWESSDAINKRREAWIKKRPPHFVPVHKNVTAPTGYFDYAGVAEAAAPAQIRFLVHHSPSSINHAPRNCLPPVCVELNFQDPIKYKKLFATALFFDRLHYTLEGANEYTRTLAETMLAAGVAP